MRLIYARHFSVSSALLRLGQWFGLWSHVGILDGYVVIHSLARKGGVVITPAEEVLRTASEYEVVDVPTPDDARGLAWAHSQVGKPYDWTGVVGIALAQRDWQEDDAWYCSELAERALAEAGLVRWRANSRGITPCMSYYNVTR